MPTLQTIALFIVFLITAGFFAILYCACVVSGNCARQEDEPVELPPLRYIDEKGELHIVERPAHVETKDGKGAVVYGEAVVKR